MSASKLNFGISRLVAITCDGISLFLSVMLSLSLCTHTFVCVCVWVVAAAFLRTTRRHNFINILYFYQFFLLILLIFFHCYYCYFRCYSGDAIPQISYTDVENQTWGAVFRTVLDLMPKHACAEYRGVFAKLQEEGIFVETRIPQLEEMSNFLRKSTGFTLRPAAGLLTARDFLASLAFRVFQSTQYVRHVNSPYHTPEP